MKTRYDNHLRLGDEVKQGVWIPVHQYPARLAINDLILLRIPANNLERSVHGVAKAGPEHLIRDDEDFRRHVEYCTINPVKHGLVTRVRDWPHSSFHRDVRAELFPPDWADDVSAEGSFGERV